MRTFRGGAFAAILTLVLAVPNPSIAELVHNGPQRTDDQNQHPDCYNAKCENLLPLAPLPVLKVEPGYLEYASADERADHSEGPKWTDIAIVFLTVGLVIAALLQWCSMRGQEAQLRRSIIDARRASNRQSRQTQSSIEQSSKAADAATEANKLSHTSLIASERPWVSIVVTPCTNLEWQDGDISFSVNFALRNTGKTPATFAFVHPQLLMVLDDQCVAEKQAKIVEMATAPASMILGQGLPLFPRGVANQKAIFSVSKEIIAEGFNRMKAVSETEPTSVPLCLFGCVVYKAPIDDSIHKTAFCLDIMEAKVIAKGVQNVSPAINRNIAQASIALGFRPGGNYAD